MESAMESTAASVLVDTFSEPFTLELHEASLSPGSRDLEEADFELSVGQEVGFFKFEIFTWYAITPISS